ncbi:MAG: hypothetical protein KJN64_02295 [Ignavibacteria bacterium]|nr:hypothetical protein [Ignavibacteria bacterium]MBT8381467.1 hypothetical protein [Ignavibacteria bacterium]MBT8391529.1 hypothetical protein [Ignavibacteria bacterium]NNJ52221.1 hypothetical protein [Ignavibacteriaceae bacterium]NNL22697.1 hypothetical protein [Ignavibacteriaceae bacterium]
MKDNCKVLSPIKFNCWKHHALFIKNKLKNYKSEAQLEQLHPTILKIGDSQMDLYYGNLSPDEISNRIINFLDLNSIKNNKKYLCWLCSDGNDYKSMKLKDSSVWTLRSGNEEKRFVHIHPGRYSPHTVRVKALTLKTAIYVSAYSKVKYISVYDIDLINKTRLKYLDASPLKFVNKETGLGKLLTLFNSLK